MTDLLLGIDIGGTGLRAALAWQATPTGHTTPAGPVRESG